MADTADLDGKVTSLDIDELDSWFRRLGRSADGIGAALGNPPAGASTVVGKDPRLHGARRLGIRHDAALIRATEAAGEISDLVRRLRDSGHRVIDVHARSDADGADGVRRATD